MTDIPLQKRKRWSWLGSNVWMRIILVLTIWLSVFRGYVPPFLSPTANRTLYFKLPIEGAEFHWRLLDGKAFLAGELTLRIVNERRGRDETHVVFRNGVISEGWKVIDGDSPRGDMYFGFATGNRSPTAPDDSLIITLVAPRDLHGQGPDNEGTLSAGTWQATGTYSGLYGGTLNPLGLIARWGEPPIATMECWDNVWPITITKETGWMGLRSPTDIDREEGWFERAISHRGTDGRQCVSHR
ncbi:MAG: hypothetical protein IBJ03_06345 [Gemmatimonadaceae bacterium]|nr:hypothetical protein [Gemmatimonadaceae bacterium]